MASSQDRKLVNLEADGQEVTKRGNVEKRLEAESGGGDQTQRLSQVTNGKLSPISHSQQSDKDKNRRIAEKEERENLLLWRKPFVTSKYFLIELKEQLAVIPKVIGQHIIPAIIIVILAGALTLLYSMPGPYQPLMRMLHKKVSWCLYWFGLGVLSSIGLGTGLHTFLLYLGPHIASVTLAAYECGSLNFPEPPYPDEIVCGSEVDPVWATSLWTVVCKVWVEAVMWGAGTAAGELPPYFMARTARLSGYDPEDEDELREFQEFQRKKEEHPELLTYVDRMKVMVENLVAKVGFFGILACASIPNPLFDLAGITCGHFLVPFWTFFGATLIGKAVIKMMIQQIFVIVAFNEALIANAVNSMSLIPVVGHRLQKPVTEFFKKQKERLHRKGGSSPVDQGANWIGKAFELFVLAMVLYFIVSIIHSFAQNYHKRLCKIEAQKRDSNKSKVNKTKDLRKSELVKRD